MRLGLCCRFRDQPIKFVTTTVAAVSKMTRRDALAKLSRLCLENADALLASLQFCAANGIGCFRINSRILPIKTHPTCGYEVDDLPEGDEIIRRFQECGQYARQHKLRTCFHPDQFVVLNSPRPDVVEKSIQELEYQGVVARMGRGGCGEHSRRRGLRRQAKGTGRFCPVASSFFPTGSEAD